jgi:hypothetical protein
MATLSAPADAMSAPDKNIEAALARRSHPIGHTVAKCLPGIDF